ncbi:MAG: hypothetical protein COB66_00610 [Coxiella sp. (in: Bacteria)]|nr:MAG: hypothetical protein COB66_00610 [Coxiella sp. (in: g-proteobacteria)]
METQLHEGEEILLNIKPHKKFAWYWALSRIRHVLLILIILAIFFVFSGGDNSGNNASVSQTLEQGKSFFHHYGAGVFVGLLVVAVVLFFLIYLWARMATKKYDYCITNQRCILTSGFLSLNKRMIPYSSVNDVNMRTSLVERLFGLTSVYLDSIGTMMSGSRFRSGSNSNNTTRLEGITMEDCDKVMEIVSKHISQK